MRLAGEKQDVGGRGEGKVETLTADEHLMSRLKATYLGMYKDDGGDGDDGKKGEKGSA